MTYNKINNLFGWLCFSIAAITYILTLERSVSFWDCGEFISCAYLLQVSHQPGYPMFALLGKAFSLLSMGNRAKVAYFTNMGFALCSATAIMFLFWTVTAVARKLLVKRGETVNTQQLILIIGAGLAGALTLAFSDTFWFSAVETIVFSPAMLCTSLVVWAIMKWDNHADEPGADKWLVFIAYIMGLSIGIHLLNLLTIPAITLIYYFRRYKTICTRNTIIAILLGVGLLAVVQFGIIQYTVKAAAYVDLFTVNSLGFGFNVGALLFIALLLSALAYGIYYSIKHQKPALNLALVCLVFIYFGYGSFVMVPIRAHANTYLNNTHPDDAFTLNSYLTRIQYEQPPLLYGNYFDGKPVDQKDGVTIYRKGDKKYEIADKRQDMVYDHNTILPRIYSTDANNVQFYKEWLQLGDNQSPAFGDNLKFMFSWQLYQMYFRYFMWNFAGRYNDVDGQASTASLDGNWTTGWFDHAKHLPNSVLHSNTYTPLYALPLIIGLIGMVYQYRRNGNDALVITLLYFFMGIAIVLYVNQPGLQPRERDYSYIGSFYAFAIWVGIGVIGLADLLMKKLNARAAAMVAAAACLLAAPVLMAVQEWGDHDRSTKLVAHDMAYNYLNSCPKNAILFTYGDNETYPVWYDQQVEGIRPDVRVVNLSLFGMDWNIRQMQRPMLNAAALPISMPFDKYKEGTRDVIYYNDAKLSDSVELKEVFDFITSDDPRTKVQYESGEMANYLPTKRFKMTINTDEIIKDGVAAPDQKNRIAGTMEWQFPGNFITKDYLALMDILVHNNWKRPICFTTSCPPASVLGLNDYLYREGMVNHLIPFKPDTTDKQVDRINTRVMYDQILNQFRFGNMKKARYLDEQSTQLFYPMLLNNFVSLTYNLLKENHPEMALNTLHKFDEVMPDLNPYIDLAAPKLYLADTAFKLKDINLGRRLVNSVRTFVKDQLDYNYHLLQNSPDTMDLHTVQVGISSLNSMAMIAKNNKDQVFYASVDRQLQDYESKFASVLNR